MALSSTKDFWIHPNALAITLNYFGNPHLIQTSMLAGAVIMAYERNIITYDAAHNFREWKLQSYPTQLSDTCKYYVHAELSRQGETAMIIYSPTRRDLEGRTLVDDTWDDTTSTTSYFIYLGEISASVDANGATVERVWLDGLYTGTLDTDQHRMEEAQGEWTQMFQLNTSTGLIDVLKTISSAIINKLTVAKEFVFGGKTFTSVASTEESGDEKKRNDATLPTTGYVQKEIESLDDHFLIKDDPDADQSVSGHVTFNKDVDVEGNQSVGGNSTIAGDQVVSGNSTIGGNQSVGSQTVNGEQIVKGEQTLHEGVTFGSEGFVDGLTGWGGKIDGEARGTLRSLRLWESLEVPELRYNRIEIQAGNSWRSAGGGIIEKVEQEYDSDGNPLAGGIITLRLEDGEIGKIAKDDICMGVFHNMTNANANETIDSDDSRGNFTFAGFFTAYFRVTEILDNGNNGRFRYVLRGSDGTGGSWNRTYHPCKDMHFAAYGNFTDPTRQDSRYSTLTYERYLRGVNTWEFGVDNIAAQFGDLSNLSILGLNMTGYSVYIDNAYMRGYIQQVNVLPLRMEIVTDGYTTMAYGETMNVECHVYRGWEELTDSVTEWSIVRETADTADDAAWGLKDKVKKFAGAIDIAWNEQENDLGDMSKAGISALFTITAKVSDETTSASIEI